MNLNSIAFFFAKVSQKPQVFDYVSYNMLALLTLLQNSKDQENIIFLWVAFSHVFHSHSLGGYRTKTGFMIEIGQALVN